MAADLSKTLGIVFDNPRLLQSAMIHRSFLNEHPERTDGLSSNERLEFLGDAVLNFLTSSWLYEHAPTLSEGEMSKWRTALVKKTTLARFARTLELGSYVRIARSEDTPIARNRDPLLADLFEAVLGAIYLDQGIDRVWEFLQPFLEAEKERIVAGLVEIDYRTRLQQVVQANNGDIPVYQTIAESGPKHSRQFTIEVQVRGTCLGVGTGTSKQEAAKAAARMALETLRAL